MREKREKNPVSVNRVVVLVVVDVVDIIHHPIMRDWHVSTQHSLRRLLGAGSVIKKEKERRSEKGEKMGHGEVGVVVSSSGPKLTATTRDKSKIPKQTTS